MINKRKPAHILRYLTRKKGELVINLELGASLREEIRWSSRARKQLYAIKRGSNVRSFMRALG